MPKPFHALLIALALSALVAGVGLAIRPLTPVDETRYVGVAHEMHATGDWLVPHNQGRPYADKPPVLFWLMNLAWALFGDREWAARLVAPALGMAVLVGSARLARLLWPELPHAHAAAPLILAGGLAWCAYSSFVMFDAPLSACVLLATGCGLLASRGRTLAWMAATGVALGVGVLVKGPVVFLHVLPVLLLAPLWTRRRERGAQPPLARWYGGVGMAAGIAALIAFAWALPAAHAGGAEFASNLLWRQTANRMVNAFAHGRPVYWYLPVLPLALLPWSLWPGAWAAVARLRDGLDEGSAFCATWAASVFVALSLVGGKQVHYLLPALPAAALLLARHLPLEPVATRRSMVPVGIGLAAIGGALLFLGSHARANAEALTPGVTPAFIHARTAEPVALIALAVVLVALAPLMGRRVVPGLAVVGVVVVLLAQATVTGWGSAHGKPWPPWEAAARTPNPRQSVSVPARGAASRSSADRR